MKIEIEVAFDSDGRWRAYGSTMHAGAMDYLSKSYLEEGMMHVTAKRFTLEVDMDMAKLPPKEAEVLKMEKK